jgi:hypothetical protein
MKQFIIWNLWNLETLLWGSILIVGVVAIAVRHGRKP